MKWAGTAAGLGATGALVLLFVLAGDPGRLGRVMLRLAQVLPSTLAGLIAKVAEKFAHGLGAIRRPSRLLLSLLLSLPLWLSICLGIWSVTMAFGFDVPFTGSFLWWHPDARRGIDARAVGGFHEAFRWRPPSFRAGRRGGGRRDRVACSPSVRAAARSAVRGAGRLNVNGCAGSPTSAPGHGFDMKCPYRGHLGDKVVDSREGKEGRSSGGAGVPRLWQTLASYERIDGSRTWW